MAKQITPQRAFELSFSPFRYRALKTDKGGRTIKDDEGNPVYEIAETARFIKQGETQAAAIKRLRNHALGRTKFKDLRRFPSFFPGVTSAATYVAQFESMNNLRPTGSAAHLTHPSPINVGPELIFNEFAEDLV